MQRRLTITGVVITLIWLATMASMALTARESSLPLKLNEWGDFFAGFFAPVAFLWLVLGYIQQGQELRLSTRALELQAQELRNSVDQQRQLLEVTREQVDAEVNALREASHSRKEAAKPRIVIHCFHSDFIPEMAEYTASIENVGNTITEVNFTFTPDMNDSTLFPKPVFPRDLKYEFDFSYKAREAQPGTTLLVTYIDADGIPGQDAFDLIAIREDMGPGGPHTRVRFSPVLPNHSLKLSTRAAYGS